MSAAYAVGLSIVSVHQQSHALQHSLLIRPTTAGLYVPTSDIDLVITESRESNIQYALKTLATALTKKGVAHKMQVID